jgi:hypothetical protein
MDVRIQEMGRIVEEGCGVILTRDQQSKIATKRAELQGMQQRERRVET